MAPRKGFAGHLADAVKDKKPSVAGGPSAADVMDHFDVTPPDPTLHGAYAGEHSATLKSGKDLHTHHDTAKKAAAEHERLSNIDPASLADDTARTQHAADLAAAEKAKGTAGLKGHSQTDLTHEALEHRVDAIGAAKTKALEELEKNPGKLSADALAAERAAIEKAAETELKHVKAAGGALNGARTEIAEATGVASKWEKGAANSLVKDTEKSGTFLGSKMLGGVKSGVAQNWKGGTVMGKAKVVVGGIMVADGVRRIVGDVSTMMSGEKGLDKNGQPLPSPGIMNLAFDIGETGLGAVVASSQMFTKGGR